jgi:hypothetical protein
MLLFSVRSIRSPLPAVSVARLHIQKVLGRSAPGSRSAFHVQALWLDRSRRSFQCEIGKRRKWNRRPTIRFDEARANKRVQIIYTNHFPTAWFVNGQRSSFFQSLKRALRNPEIFGRFLETQPFSGFTHAAIASLSIFSRIASRMMSDGFRWRIFATCCRRFFSFSGIRAFTSESRTSCSIVCPNVPRLGTAWQAFF